MSAEMTPQTAPPREWNGEQIGTPLTIYAVVCGNYAAYVVWKDGDGRLHFHNDEDGEYTYAECEYGGLTGLVVFDGHLQTRAAFAAAGYGWPHSGEFDEWTTGKWRQMTTDEAVSLGLLAPHARVGGAGR